MKCELCGKSRSTGFTVSHSKRHTKRDWLPNIHPANITINGEVKHLKVCTRCLRTQHKLAKTA
ncbi:MAG: 50S ribosomal protein L28 [Dehalococcoidales bacterium]|nr:50S ribosomal protein L28 [Dehalococcoidales bacterium]